MYVCSTQQVKGRLQVKATEITPEASQCWHNEDEEGHQAHEINEGASAHQAQRGASAHKGARYEINEEPVHEINEGASAHQDYAEAKYYQFSFSLFLLLAIFFVCWFTCSFTYSFW